MGRACTAPTVMGGGDFSGVDQRLKVTVAHHRFQSFILGYGVLPTNLGFGLPPRL